MSEQQMTPAPRRIRSFQALRRTAAFPVRRDKAAHFQRVQAPPGQPLQPEATGAGMEATKCKALG